MSRQTLKEKMRGEGTTVFSERPVKRLSTLDGESLLGNPMIPSRPSQQLEVDQEGQPVEKREAAEVHEHEHESKAARFERAESPSSSPKVGLFSPLLPGKIGVVNKPHADVSCGKRGL